MTSTNGRKVRFCARLTLLAALLHQSGACPCGCIEHDLWIAAARSALGLGQLDSPGAGYDRGERTVGDDDHHCHGGPPAVFVHSRSAFEADGALGLKIPAPLGAAASHCDAADAVVVRESIPPLQSPASAPSAARAALQVYLI